MSNFYETKGILSVSIGEGYLSSFEISTLKPGDIIKTSKLAGYPSTIYFNGDFLCHGEIVIIGHLFGVRVTHLSKIDIPERVPANSDDVLEILPIKIEIGKINLSPKDLKSIGYGTIISLAKPYTEKEDAELAVAGIPVASGKVVVIYENMGLKVSKIYGSQFEENNIRTSGFLLDAYYDTSYVKDHNFKRPDKFSKNAIDKIRQIHQLFTRNMGVKVEEFSSYEVVDIDQATFAEVFTEINDNNIGYLLSQNVPWNRPYLQTESIEHGANRKIIKTLVEPDNTEHKVHRQDAEYIEKLAFADGKMSQKPIIICYTKNSLFKCLLKDDPEQTMLLSSLRGGWKNFVDLNTKLTKATDSFEHIRVINDNEMIIIISIVDKNNPDNKLFFIYPYLTLEPIIRILN